MLLAVAMLAACAAMPGRDPLRVEVVGIEPAEGQGLELRLAVKLRIQNPNDGAVEFDGTALELDVNGKTLATGVSDQKGSVPRYGESILVIPVSISAMNAVRQALVLADGT
ncbi:MAG TPA: LEA type 2 family protein, partial [Piscinibacter sp.]|nr:LEA type 2 family protein [Piscinibacter sp.]